MAPASPPPSPSATSVRSHSVSTCYTLRVPELAPALGTWAQRRRRISSFLHIHPREQSNLHRYNAERHRHDNDNDDDEEVTATHHAHHAPLSASIASHLHQLHLPTFHIAGFGLHRSQSGTLQRSESMVSLCFRSLAGFIAEDNLPGLQAFLENRQVQVDDRDENGTTPLMVAASKGRLSFVRELLAHGADPNAEDADSWTALLCSAKEGHTDICAELISHGALLEHRDPGIWTALMWAAYKGRTEVVNLLVEKGADVNAHGNFHISSLLWAAGRGHSQIVRTLVTHGAKVNIGDKYGTTALIWASRCGVADSVECLLRAGANVDTAGMYSWTSLLVATMGNHADVVHFLLEHRPNVNALDKDGCTALTISCKEGYHEIAVALLNAGAYINIQDRAGDTNLIHAVKGNHRSIVEALLKKYADVDIPGKERKTAIYNAVEKGNVAIVKMLLNANPDLEISTKDGDTALLRAVRIRNVEIVQLLLDKRAKVSAADKKGDTALHVAMRARSKGIIETLLRNPKNSHLLYRPNRQGETPYNIDLGHQKTILGQIFGARRLNTNEDNENMLGYDLYSSALADVLSEPSLSMPITVGLYAKWGSGKSFLLNKLREEMKNFARQWIEPSFQFSYLLLMLVLHTAILLGAVVGVSSGEWIAGVSTAVGLVILLHVALFVINFVNRRYDWDWPYNFNVALTKKLNSFKLILQIVFCHPPGSPGSDGVTAQPIRFYFTEQTRVSSTTSSENSVVQMLGSLYDAIETDFGALSTRLYRAFRPKLAKQNSSWRWRRLCCLPYVVIFEFCFIAALVIAVLLFYYFQIDPALQILLITFGVLLAVAIIANLYTWGRMISALTRSQRRHLHRTISCLDTLKSEGFLQALRSEVNLMTEMVKCLDRLTDQQTRLVIIVDGLDSSEQDKVLLVLDAVHLLFSDANCPFIIILAIDPHTISKALEVNSKRLFNESNIGGHDYLRNMVHLPFYLQNSGLRKVKVAQHTAQLHRRLGGSSIDEYAGPSATLGRSMSNRRLSQESGLMSSCEKLKPPPPRKGSRKLKLSDSIASSIGSNLNRIGGAHDLTKMLLTDDYFSDVNPRSMRRLLNVVYITGRLLKAFQIDFNWYHLASWINITEQWPFRTSWIILYHELHEESLDDGMSMKTLYDKIRPQIPILKEVEPLLELDRDERKFDVFLSFHRSSLLISDLKIFLPFTINLDPYIKKVIKEQQSIEEEGLLNNMPPHSHAIPQAQHNVWNNPTMPPQIWHNPMTKPPLVRRQRPYSRAPIPQQVNQMTELMYSTPPQNILAGWQPHPVAWIDQQMKQPQTFLEMPNATLSKEILELKLSTLSVDGVADLLSKLDDLTPNMRPRYAAVVKENNINGRVLSHCDLEDLKKVLIMNFGDWELFRMLIMYMRDHEHSVMSRSDEPTPVTTVSTRPVLTSTRSIAGEKNSATSSSESTQSSSVTNKGTNRHSIMEKQVTLEEQMICGALQTLNEEACEDVLDEGDSSSLRSESPEHEDGAAGGIPSVTVSGSILAGHMLNLSEPDVIIESHHLLSIDEENDGYKNGGFCQKDKYFGEINEQNPKRTKQQSLANTVLSKSIDIRETGSAQSSMYGQNAKHDSIKMGERILQQRPNSLPDNSFHLSNHTPTCSLEKLTILKDKFLSLTCDNKYNTSGNMDIDSDDESTPLVSEKSKSELTSAAESPITPASVDIVFYGQSRHASNQDLTDFTDVSPSSRCVESPKNKLNCNSSCNVLSPDEIANFSLSTSDVTHTCVINTGNCYPLLSKDRGDSLSNAYGKIESGFSRQNAVDEYDCEDFYGDPETTV